MNITVVNQPLNNRGDEAAHRSLMLMLKENFPKDVITMLFVGVNPDSVRQFKVHGENIRYVNLKAFPKYGFLMHLALKHGIAKLVRYMHPTHFKVFRLIKRSDLVVCAPGGVCMGAYQSWSHIWYLKVALTLKKKIAYYSRSIGPFPVKTESQKRFKSISLDILGKLDFISLRDVQSQQLAKDFGLNIVNSIDTAFLNTPNVKIPASIETGDKYIVFVPNQLSWHPSFKNIDSKQINSFYIKVMNLLLEVNKEINIVMLPQLFNSGTKNDVNYFRALALNFKSERIKIIDDVYSSDIQQAIISKSLFLIGARYHSVIFSLNNLVPFIALSYEHKISGLLEMLKMEDHFIDLHTLFLENNSEQNKNQKEVLSKIKDSLEKNIINREDITVKKEMAVRIANDCASIFVSKYKHD